MSGVQFANCSVNISAFEHIFGRVCREHDMDHRLTKVKRLWTNGQVERMNRTIKEGEADQKTIRGIAFPLNVKRFHYDSRHERPISLPVLQGFCLPAGGLSANHGVKPGDVAAGSFPMEKENAGSLQVGRIAGTAGTAVHRDMMPAAAEKRAEGDPGYI